MDGGLRCKENGSILIEYKKKAISINRAKKKQQKNTQLLAAGRNDSPMS